MITDEEVPTAAGTHHTDALVAQSFVPYTEQVAPCGNGGFTRPHVDRIISEVTTQDGRRVKLRCRGTANNNAWIKRRTGVLNLRALIHRRLTRPAHREPNHIATPQRPHLPLAKARPGDRRRPRFADPPPTSCPCRQQSQKPTSSARSQAR